MDNEVLFRDSRDIQPPATAYERVATENIYASLEEAAFVPCPEDIWQPAQRSAAEKEVVEVKGSTARQQAWKVVQRRAVYAIDHKLAVTIIFLMTCWALFMDDVQLGVPMPKTVDIPFAYVTLVFLILFTIEQVVRSVVQFDEYCFSFFWFMELVANASMILQLGPLMSPEGVCHQETNIASLLSSGGLAAGSRLARVMRLLRVIRVLRVFNSCSKQRNPNAAVHKNRQSAVGKRLNEMLVRSMIVIVIALLTIFPILSFEGVDTSRALAFNMLIFGSTMNLSTYPQMLHTYQFQGEHHNNIDSVGDYVRGVQRLLKTKVNDKGTLFLQTSDTTGTLYGVESSGANSCFGDPSHTFAHCPPDIAKLRCRALQTYPGPRADPATPNIVYWDTTRLVQWEAVFNIVLTNLLAVVIIVMYVLLSMDVTSMVVQPIESMVGLVRRLAENPTLQLEGQSKSKYETEAVRIALAKIVGLMQLGFGGAGHEIISANLANSEKAGLDLMLKGKKRECAYGFCDIRQFTDTVECLQDQVMLFTNSVGEIVHQACHDNRGEPNKNIGDAFLIVWRPRTPGDHSKLVDGALTSFRRCVREIASSQTLQLVTNVEAIHKKFGRGKYRTKLGFGLHFGWSVEGPVGSPTKIDCSYLSPEVKISDRLEAATKIYSSNILMSGQFYDLLSDHIKVGIRLIDHVTLKGGVKPFRIYADDRSNLWLKMNPKLVDIYGAEAAYEQFSKTFHEGVDAFIKGDWPAAQQKLEGAHDFCPKDVPTMLLMKEMKRRSIDPNTPTAPVDWKGYHDSDV